ncbi:hypothetical protein LJC42_08435, partial [Eubacteriales bacterium OttesenSCG-928-K08]|nr:hypothetical protein [Eubacteriales bacterium OttesenSCG-928-K08]
SSELILKKGYVWGNVVSPTLHKIISRRRSMRRYLQESILQLNPACARMTQNNCNEKVGPMPSVLKEKAAG